MKLSEIGQQKVSVVSEPEEQKPASQGATLKLSEIKPDAVTVVYQPKTESETELDQVRNRAASWMEHPAAIGRQIDRFTGAPVRAAIGAYQDDKGILEQVSAFGSQFLKQPEEAPTGKEIATKAGLSTENKWSIPGLKIPQATDGKGITYDEFKFSPAGVAGLGIDVAADWTNVIPVTAVAKLAGKGVAKTTVLGIKAGAGAADMATGSKIGTAALKYSAEKGKAVKLAFSNLFNPKQAADFPDMVRIAQRNGINDSLLPEAVEFGHNSLITRAARVRAEGTLGEGQLDKFFEGLQQTKNATTGVIQNIAGGNRLSKVEAGRVIRQGYDNAVARLFNGMDDTYSKIAARNPGLRLNDASAGKLYDTLNDLQSFAQGRLSRGVTSQQKSQAKQLLEAIEAVKSTGQPSVGMGPPAAPSMQGIVEVMRNTGEAAFKKGSGIAIDPPDVQRLRTLYGDLREAVLDTIETSVPDGVNVANTLKANNKAISEFMDDSSVLARTIKGDISDETIFSRLVEQGDTKKVEALAKVLTPQEMQEVKGAFLESLLSRNAEDDFTFKMTINRMKPKQSVMEQLFTPEEIKEFTDVLRLGDRFGDPIMSKSGTGASNILKNAVQSTKDAIINDSFIDTLKQRARGNPGGTPMDFSVSAKPGTAFTGEGYFSDAADGLDFSGAASMKPAPGGSNYFNGVKQTLINRLPSGTEIRLKGLKATSTQDIDANDGRKEAIRRKILNRGNN